MRTGAVGGVALRYLAPEDAASVGLVGCGMQGLHQLLYALSLIHIFATINTKAIGTPNARNKKKLPNKIILLNILTSYSSSPGRGIFFASP